MEGKARNGLLCHFYVSLARLLPRVIIPNVWSLLRLHHAKRRVMAYAVLALVLGPRCIVRFIELAVKACFRIAERRRDHPRLRRRLADHLSLPRRVISNHKPASIA